jgi:hypothetical protein
MITEVNTKSSFNPESMTSMIYYTVTLPATIKPYYHWHFYGIGIGTNVNYSGTYIRPIGTINKVKLILFDDSLPKHSEAH